MLRSPERGSFEHLVRTVGIEVSRMWRLSVDPSREPYWSRSASHRFDDPLSDASQRFGMLYAAQDLETAFCESVLHECSLFVGGCNVVPRCEMDGRSLVRLHHPHAERLRLADMTGKALKAMGLNNDLSAGDDYRLPQRWSRALFEAKPRLDGIRYRSRQRNDRYCYALFDRSGVAGADASTLTSAEKADLCRRFNVDLV